MANPPLEEFKKYWKHITLAILVCVIAISLLSCGYAISTPIVLLVVGAIFLLLRSTWRSENLRTIVIVVAIMLVLAFFGLWALTAYISDNSKTHLISELTNRGLSQIIRSMNL
jgi:hypothetical protein